MWKTYSAFSHVSVGDHFLIVKYQVGLCIARMIALRQRWAGRDGYVAEPNRCYVTAPVRQGRSPPGLWLGRPCGPLDRRLAPSVGGSAGGLHQGKGEKQLGMRLGSWSKPMPFQIGIRLGQPLSRIPLKSRHAGKPS